MKVKVLYQTVNEIEIEVDEKFTECVRFADISWDKFPLDRIDKWFDDREKMRLEIAEKLFQIDNGFDDIITITTENNNIIYESQ